MDTIFLRCLSGENEKVSCTFSLEESTTILFGLYHGFKQFEGLVAIYMEGGKQREPELGVH
jgi:hypothetical protein